METCQRCGTVLPTTPGARYCPQCGQLSASAPESGMTWALPAQDDATQAIPVQRTPPEPDPYAHLYRPEGELARVSPNATQVMPPVPADYGRSDYEQPAYGQPAYEQPAYDQPIDYQSGGGGAYAEPYEDPYAEDYPDRPDAGARSGRGAKIGIGVAAGAILVIVISLITLGGHKQTPAAAPGGTQGTVTTPTGTPSPTTPASTSATTAASSPSSTTSSSSPHIPGVLQLGDTGTDVKWVQTRLRQLRFYKGSISGTYDAATKAAVAAFQAKTHASSDPSGDVGRSTKTALIAYGTKPTLVAQLPDMPSIGKHHKSSGADVERLQRALASALNTSVAVTGKFDVDTFAAVVQYQSAMHLTADGIVTGSTWSALQEGRIVR